MSFFGGEKRRPPSDKIENVLGASARFSGHLQAEGGVRIDGVFEGTVETEGNLIVGKDAQVIADVKAYNITVAGVIEGNVTAAGRLEILSTGRVRGDISTASLLIEEGGVFHGKSLMEDEVPRLEPPKAEPESGHSEDGETEPSPVKRGEIVDEGGVESGN
jgi:cytoskeletal protein CcmA (bactofilin family)